MKIKFQLGLLGAVMLCALSQTATAGLQDRFAARDTKILAARFAQADKDHDGKLTLDEAKAGMPLVAKNFAKVDKANSGFVTIADIKAAIAAGVMSASAATSGTADAPAKAPAAATATTAAAPTVSADAPATPAPAAN